MVLIASAYARKAMKTINTINPLTDLAYSRERYFYTDVEKILGLKRSAVKLRRKAANITPYVDENTQEYYFDSEQIIELKKCHDFMLGGGLAKNYQGKYTNATGSATGGATGDATGSIVPISGNTEDLNWLFAWDERDEQRRNAMDEIYMSPRINAYVRFEVYIELQQYISDSECIEIIGWKPPRTNFIEGEYKFVRVGRSNVYNKSTNKFDRQSLWKIVKLNLEQNVQKKDVENIK